MARTPPLSSGHTLSLSRSGGVGPGTSSSTGSRSRKKSHRGRRTLTRTTSSSSSPSISTGPHPPTAVVAEPSPEAAVGAATDADDAASNPPCPAPLRAIHTLDLRGSETQPTAVALTHGTLAVGCQTGQVLLYDPSTFELRATLVGHVRAVLSLTFAPATTTGPTSLVSTSADGTVRVWDPVSARPLAVLIAADAGSVYASVCAAGKMWLGCQNTSLQWADDVLLTKSQQQANKDILAAREFSFFFSERTLESFASSQSERLPAISVVPDANVLAHAHAGYIYAVAAHATRPWIVTGAGDGAVHVWDVSNAPPVHVRSYSIAESAADDAGIPGTADMGVTALAVSGSTLYAGCQGGTIVVWDMDTGACVRRLVEHHDDVTWLGVIDASHLGTATSPSAPTKQDGSTRHQDHVPHLLVSAGMDGDVRLWRPRENWSCLAIARPVTTPSTTTAAAVLSASMTDARLTAVYLDGTCRIWELPMDVIADATVLCAAAPDLSPNHDTTDHMSDAMLFALREWISFRTVSGAPEFAEDCRAGAQFLRSVLTQLGAEASLLASAPGHNPLVFGRFHPTTSTKKPTIETPPHIVIYGHYDVVKAERASGWTTDPFQLTGRNGILYGRGVSDDKGPMLAAVFAVAELVAAGDLHATVTFLIEGEEESGSVGLQAAFDAHETAILGSRGRADVILMSNSSWLGTQLPCLVYSQRGVVHAAVTVEDGVAYDRHAGVDGGNAATEPLPDLVHLLSHLTDPAAPRDRRVRIPGFYDGVAAELAPADEAKYDALVARVLAADDAPPPSVEGHRSCALKRSLIRKWQTPSLTMSRVTTSGGGLDGRTVIPHRATAHISLRTVPGQDTQALVARLRSHLADAFERLQLSRLDAEEAEGYSRQCGAGRPAPNKLTVDVTTAADSWQSSPDHPCFLACAAAVERVWGIEPLCVREGGSTLPLHWLKQRLAPSSGGSGDNDENVEVPIVNVPLAQSTDQAHLAQEQISVRHLLQGRAVIRECVRNLQAHFLGLSQ